MPDLRGEINKPTLRAEDFNIPFSTSDRTRKKISKDIEENNDQQDLIDIVRTLHPITEELHSLFIP